MVGLNSIVVDIMTCNLSCWWTGSRYLGPNSSLHLSINGVDCTKYYGIALCPVSGSVAGASLEIVDTGAGYPNHVFVDIKNNGTVGVVFTVQGITVG